MMKYIVSFSGGKDSTAMLLMLLEKGWPVDRIISVDTTKQFPEMNDHIKKVQLMVEPIKIEIVKIDFDYWFGEKKIEQGNNKERKGYGWPVMPNRWCTGKKIQAMRRLISKNDVEYIGIASDETKRTQRDYINKQNVRFPLVDWEITEKQALEYCYSKGLYWNGLYEKFSRVGCWCCPMARMAELKILYNNFPELWGELREMDKKTYKPFKNGYSIQDLEQRFAFEDMQIEMFESVEV